MNVMQNEPADLSKYHYAIYARKSTEDANKQVRSIEDQITECKILAANLGLNVVRIIRETKSAKTPNKRPEFTKMIKDVKGGQLDGVIAWHPDRLARNMVEAGKIIYYLDTNILKDLRFQSHQFSNDANGKMLLGLLFVIAKHYSDDLKAKVERGIKHNLEEGKSSGSPKYGYIRDKDGIYRPDGDNFKIVQQAWFLRAEGKTLEEVAGFLNQQGLTRYKKVADKRAPLKAQKSMLGRMFADTFYFGVLNQTNQSIDLRELGISFEPMIDKETFAKVQELSYARKRGQNKRAAFYPLRDLVFCGICNDPRPMSVGKSKGSDGLYRLYYRCKGEECTRKPKSTRANIILGAVGRVIDDNLAHLPQSTYDEYLKELDEIGKVGLANIRNEVTRAKTTLAAYKREQLALLVSVNGLTDERARNMANSRISEISIDMERLEKTIAKNQAAINKGELPRLTSEEFWAVIQLSSTKLKAADPVQKDIIVRNYFLKLHFDNEKAVSYIWREPFASLLNFAKVPSGGATGT